MNIHTLILILHVLGAGVIIGIVFFSLVVSYRPRSWSAAALDRLHFVGKFGMWASAWMFVTGLILAFQDWEVLRTNWIFWGKMAAYVVEGIFAGALLTRIVMQARVELRPRGLGTIMLTHALLILLIISLGVMLVEQ